VREEIYNLKFRIFRIFFLKAKLSLGVAASIKQVHLQQTHKVRKIEVANHL